ncbi:MAG TPA: ATP-binding protein [Nocardioides sp.]
MATVDIQPPNDIYATFGRLNYKPWYALAEFVDNATQNFFTHASRIAELTGEDALLDIDISYDSNARVLTVADNAHGMDLAELTRAMKISAPPPDRSGRSEFGMGLKTAACWFGSRWTVTTTQLGEPTTYSVVFDVEELSASGSKALEVQEAPANDLDHGTTLVIEGLRKPIVGRQVEKVRKTLTSMYRQDITSGRVQVTWNGAPLAYLPSPLWQHERPDGTGHEMRQSLDLVVTDPATGHEHAVHGWVGVLEKMSSSDNGFALFRRGRLIIGLPSEGWRPSELMGQTGSPEWKRITGELHMNDFPVNFTKDGFAWEGGLEDALIEALTPLVETYKAFARDLRVRGKGGPVSAKDFVRAMDEVQEGLRAPELARELVTIGMPPPSGEERLREEMVVEDAEVVPRTLEVVMPTGKLRATLYTKDEGKGAPWISVQSVSNDDLDVIINTSHPFVAACCEDERGTVIIAKVVLALALAEQQSRLMSANELVPADDIRTYLSTFLLHSKP